MDLEDYDYGDSFSLVVRLVAYINTFWPAGFWSAALIVMVAIVFRWRHLLFDPVLGGVIAIAIWILLLTGTRRYLSGRGFRAIENAWKAMTSEPSEHSSLELQSRFTNSCMEFANLLGLRHLGPIGNDQDVSNIKSANVRPWLAEELEDVLSSWYMPLQALLWCLPALGFVGAALHMITAIRKLVSTGWNTDALSSGVVIEITPSLTGALLVVCVALTFTAICYMAVALTLKADIDGIRDIRYMLTMTRGSAVPRTRKSLGGARL